MMKKRSFLTSLCAALLCGLLFFTAASPAAAALAINSQESSGVAHHSATSPTSWSFTNTSGTLLVVTFAITTNCGSGCSYTASATYNGVSMTPIPGASLVSCNTEVETFSFYLEGAATGAHSVSVTWTESGTGITTSDSLGAAISFTGEKSAAPVANGNAASNDPSTACTTFGTAAAVTVSSTTNGDYVLNAAVSGSSWTGPTSPATQSALLNQSGSFAGDNFIMSYQTTSGGSVTTGNTVSASDTWNIVAAEIVAAPAVTCTGKLMLLGVGC